MSTSPAATPNPYVGPRAFETGERLYGRDLEANRLCDLLTAQRIVLFYSPSGAGKTSLIRAALLPRLEKEGFVVRPVMRVGMQPAGENGRAADAPNRYVLSALQSLEEAQPEDRRLPLDALAAVDFPSYLSRVRPTADDADNDPGLEVLIFDQFEEALTVDPTDRVAKAAFFAQVGAALRDRRRWALFAMREDHIAGLDPYLRAIPTRLGTTFRLDLLGPEAARLAMRGPAAAVGVEFAESAAQKLADDLRRVRVQRPDGTMDEQPGLYVEPVQLQVVCLRLWEQLPAGATRIEEADVEAIGDVDRALAGYYKERVTAIAEATGVAELDIRVWVGEHLITKQGLRSQVLWEPGQSQGLDDRAVWPLVDAHLVRAEQRRGATWFELAHDRLIEPVREDNDAWLRLNLSPVQLQAKVWDDQDRPTGLLLREQVLEEAERWAAGQAGRLSPTERDFLTASRERMRAEEAEQRLRDLEAAQALAVQTTARLEAEERARQEAERRSEEQTRASRRLRAGLILASVLALLAIGAAGAAFYAFNESERRGEQLEELQEANLAGALSRQLAAQALSQIEQPDLSLLLSLEANSVADTVEARSSLQAGLASNPHLAAFLRGHGESVQSVAFNPEGTLLASGGRDGRIALWDAVTRQPARDPISGQKPIARLAFGPDGQTIVAAGEDGTITIWGIDTGQPIGPATTVGDGAPPGVMALSADGTLLAWAGCAAGDRGSTSCDPVSIHVQETGTGRPLDLPIPDRTAVVTSLAFDQDRELLAVGHGDGSIVVWDLVTGEQDGDPLLGHDGDVTSLVFRDYGRLASGGVDRTVRQWDLVDGAQDGDSSAGHRGTVTSLAYDPDGQVLASGSDDRTVIRWNAQSGDQIEVPLVGHAGIVTSVAFSADGMLASGGKDRTVILWDPTVRQRLGEVLPDGHTAPVIGVDIGPDGVTLASGDAAGTVVLWDVAGRRRIESAPAPLGTGVTGLVLSPDGGTLVTGGADGSVVLWDITERRIDPSPAPFGVAVTGVAFSPDGAILALASADGRVVLWDVAAGRQVGELPPDPGVPTSVAFSPDGARLAVGRQTAGSGGAITLWDVVEGRKDDRPNFAALPYAVRSVAFHPDGGVLASGGGDGTLVLWSLDRDQPTGWPLVGHAQAITSLAFAPDGATLASSGCRLRGDSAAGPACVRGEIRLWDIASRQQIGFALTGPEAEVLSVAFGADGTMLASGDGEGNVILWDLGVASWETRACALVARNLSQREWSRYRGQEPYRRTCPEFPPGQDVPTGAPAGTPAPAVALTRSPFRARASRRCRGVRPRHRPADPCR